ncbi:Rieske 2Fe-2S domain-containing protein [Nocardioides sp.]|uniref:Rieske 2Fe-2S domain-containing protein n=1 Tax=Nocardioides sp. TaxID=35761 RepID=UPI003783273E
MTSPRRAFSSAVPSDCWYALSSSEDVGRDLLSVRTVAGPVVLYRTEGGAVVALEDRCAHRPYPLSAGSLVGDHVRCGLCGFVYDAGGQCVSVPTQPRVPFGACVTAYPVDERDSVVWVWLGEPGRARLHRVPDLPWLAGAGWDTVGATTEVAAGLLLLHENFADVTQVPFVAPEIAPAVLDGAPPPLDVVVTETTVELRRRFPPAPMPAWQAAMTGSGGRELATIQEGYFVSPALWVDHWDVADDDGVVARLRFTHLITPVDEGRSRLHWRVSRDFALGDADADEQMRTMFADYYARVRTAMELTQRVIDTDGPGPEVNVGADVAGLRVREIVLAMLADEGVVPATRA